MGHDTGRGLFLDGRPVGTLATLGGHAGLLVFVVHLTGGTPGMGYLVFNHGRNGVVGYTSFSRTVVVHGVTEPKPALLHALPPESVFFCLQL